MRMPLRISEVSRNALVGALDEADLQRWLPFMEVVDLPAGKVLSEEGVKTSHVYFPLTAIVSKLHMMENGSSAEIAVIGNEGLVGMSVVMGEISGAIRAVVLIRGAAVRMHTDFLSREVALPHIQRLLLRFIQALILQMSHTAACNRHHVLDQQLCRWLLLRLDRVQGNDLLMTQELIATMLGVRREGVTEAATKLQKAGLIRYARGRIEIVDRAGLEQRSCECYSVVKKIYDRLLPRHAPTSHDAAPYLQPQGFARGFARSPSSSWPHIAAEAPAPGPRRVALPASQFAVRHLPEHIRVPREPTDMPDGSMQLPLPGVVPQAPFGAVWPSPSRDV